MWSWTVKTDFSTSKHFKTGHRVYAAPYDL